MPDIQYVGRSCVRIRGKEGIVICDPFPRANGFDPGRPTAHIVTLSTSDASRVHAGVVKPMRDNVFVIDGPGEYEVGGVMINGVRTYRDNDNGAQRGHNTIYTLDLDDLTLCHLGELGHPLTTRQLEEIGTIDVLFIPVTSELSPAQITELIASIEPRAVVPLYDTTDQLEKLMLELGVKEWDAQDKLTVTPSSLPAEGEETRVIVMKANAITA